MIDEDDPSVLFHEGIEEREQAMLLCDVPDIVDISSLGLD